MSHPRLYLFGYPRLEYAAAPVRVQRRKALALLAYLAVTGSRHSRDALAVLLWPESEPRRAYAYLRNGLWVLNQTPLAPWLDTGRETVGLRTGGEAGVPIPQDLWLDVDRFRACLAAPAMHGHPPSELCQACLPLLTEAVELYADDFLAGFGLPDSAAFDEWQFFEAQALRGQLAAALERLVRFYAARGDFDPAITCARRRLILDPLDEPAHRRLMVLYARAGQPAAALHHYDECAALLQRDLGLSPGPETVALHRRIQAGELDAPPPSAQAPVPGGGPIPAPAHNLPAPQTSLVGRRRELADIDCLLADPGCRLLTLTGLGGSGKTRLALEAAWRATRRTSAGGAPPFPDGVFLVSFAPVSAPEFMVPVLAEALHVPLPRQGSEALQAQFLAYLRRKRMLLVLDNLEHLLDGVGLVAHMLRAAPDVKLLTTSRERLGLQGEWVLEIGGLPFPAHGESVAAETCDAVQLFLQGARRADAAFSPSGADLDAIARICRLVDGVPLGIELAATWVRVLSCPQIAAEIEANLDFLSASLRDLPERHRSLRAVFAQSWALLHGDGRACFRKLAVFHGGFTRQAAEDVAGASLAALASLVDKSLLRRLPVSAPSHPLARGEGRDHYEMHEVLRRYAAERLAAVPREGDLVRDRHAAHYLAFLRRLEPLLKGDGQILALQAISQEMENVRTAWRWAVARANFEALRDAAPALFLYYDMRSRFSEGAEIFRHAASTLDRQDAGPERALLGSLLVIQGWFLQYAAPAESRSLVEQGLACLEPAGRDRAWAFAQVLSAFAGLGLAPHEVVPRLEASLSIYTAAGDTWGQAVTSEALSYRLTRENLSLARRHAQRALDLRRQIGDRWGIALSLYSLAWIAERSGRFAPARQHYQDSLDLRRELDEDPEGAVSCLAGLARVSRKLGEYQVARQWGRESLDAARDLGNRWREAHTLAGLGLLASEQADHDEARHHLAHSLDLFEQLGACREAAFAAQALGRVALDAGRMDEAGRHFEHSLDLAADNPWALLGLGDLLAATGDAASARAYYIQALNQALYTGTWPQDDALPGLLLAMARLWLDTGEVEHAIELLATLLHDPVLGCHLRQQTEHLLAATSDRFPSPETEAALARGQTQTVRQAAEQIVGTQHRSDGIVKSPT